jgi:hypothetical protein
LPIHRKFSRPDHLPKTRCAGIICGSSRIYPAFAALGQIAQLVEQGIENPCVGGSIPSLATIKIIERLEALFLWTMPEKAGIGLDG